MTATADRLPATMPNPFVVDRVDSPWQEPDDIPGINRPAFEQSLRSVRDARATKQSRGLILHGEPGSGKTHLLHRVRRYTRTDPLAWFVYIPAVTGPARFWRHLLERFFYDLCQRSKQAEAVSATGPPSLADAADAPPGQGPLSQIEEALAKHLVNDPLGGTQHLARRWADICQQVAPGRPLFERLRPTMARLTVHRQLDADVMTALRHYLAGYHRTEAYTFLSGRDLPESALDALGLPGSLDDETRAKQGVLTFCRLAGDPFTIILAFDQLEALQIDPQDMEGLRAYAQHVVELVSESANILVISSVQTAFLDTLRRAIHTSYYDRLAQDESVLQLLTRAQAFALVEARLKRSPELAQIRASNARGDPLWPLDARAIEQAVPPGGISARGLIRACRKLFDERLGMHPVAPPPWPDLLDRAWAERLEHQLAEPLDRIDGGVYEDALLKLLQTKPPPGWRPERGSGRDLHVMLTRGADRIGISISTSPNMTSVSKHLGRLLELVRGGSLTKVIFLRDPRCPITPTARKAWERIRELEQSGHSVLSPPAEAYAALVALRRLWAESAEGTLSIDDHVVPLGDLQRWLASHTPRPLREVWEACQLTSEAVPADERTERLREALRGQWIVPLDALARAADLPPSEVERVVSEGPDFFGLLGGSPPVVFMRPDTAQELERLGGS